MFLINNSTGVHFKEGDSFVYQGNTYSIIRCQFKVIGITDREKQIVVTLLNTNSDKVASNFWKSEYGTNVNIYKDGDEYKLVELSVGSSIESYGFYYDYQGQKQWNCVGGYKIINEAINYKSAIDTNRYKQIILTLFDKIANNELKNTCIEAFNIYYDDFCKKPAASKHHHDYVGGLLQHTVEVMVFAYRIASCLNVGLDNVIVASFFHDIMKIKEYTDEGFWQDYGNKIGHVVGSAQVFKELAIKNHVSDYYIEDIVHIILSHHGKKEWGSPVEPATISAVVVHEADMLSSYINPIAIQNNSSLSKDYYFKV